MTARKRAGAGRAHLARSAPARPQAPAAPALIVAALATGLALRAIASLLPIPAVWGLDTLRVWPKPQALAILLLGAIGFVPIVARGIERALDLAGGVAARAGPALAVALGAGVGLSLYNLRDPVRWVGDFGTRIGQLVLDAPVSKVFPQAAPLDRWINIMIPRSLIDAGLDAHDALHLVGAVVGGLFTVAVLACLRAAGAARGTLIASAALVLGGGYMLHFAGYDKFGPLLLGIALAFYGAIRLARDGGAAWVLGAGLVVCLLSHRSGFLLVPAGAWALVQGFRRASGRGARIEAAAAAVAVLAAAGAMAPRALQLLDTIDRAQNLESAVASGGAPVARAVAEVATRCADALNLLFLLVPLWLAGLAAAWLVRAAPGGDAAPRFPLGPVALLALVPEVALLLVARGAQGVARDWDMHAGAALVVALAAAAALLDVWRRIGAARSLAPVATTAAAAAIALWGMHVSAPLQLARIHRLLADRGAWTVGGWARAHDFLAIWALQHQRPEEAIPLLEAAAAVAPNPRYFFQLGLAHRMLMRRDEARAAFEKAHTLDPRLADAWVGFGLLAFDDRDYPRAFACAESALAISPHRRDAKEMRDKARWEIELRK